MMGSERVFTVKDSYLELHYKKLDYLDNVNMISVILIVLFSLFVMPLGYLLNKYS